MLIFAPNISPAATCMIDGLNSLSDAEVNLIKFNKARPLNSKILEVSCRKRLHKKPFANSYKIQGLSRRSISVQMHFNVKRI